MDIKFENKFSSKTALLLVCFSGKQILNTNILSEATRKLVKDFTSKNKNKHNIIQTINLNPRANKYGVKHEIHPNLLVQHFYLPRTLWPSELLGTF